MLLGSSEKWRGRSEEAVSSCVVVRHATHGRFELHNVSDCDVASNCGGVHLLSPILRVCRWTRRRSEALYSIVARF
jgi:hypothetical protein